MGLDSPDQVAQYLSQYIWLTGKPESINSYYNLYETITPEDIMAVAKKYFKTTSLTIGTISPSDDLGVK